MRFLKKYLPQRENLQKNSSLRWVSKWLNKHPNTWHFNRLSVAKGFAVGLFAAMIPLPIQMLLAAVLAALFRGNIPIAILATWVTNPLTWVPAAYLTYKIGTLITGESAAVYQFREFHFNKESMGLFWQDFIVWVSSLGKSFFVGLPITALGSAIVGYISVLVIWRISVNAKLYYRRKKRKIKQ